MPASRLSSIRRSSSANMYGGIASRRRDGAARPRFFAGAAMGLGSLELLQRPLELGGELSGVEGLGPAGEPKREVLADLDTEVAPLELGDEGARCARQVRGDRRAAGARSGRER